MAKKLGFKVPPSGVRIRHDLRLYYQHVDENGAVVAEELAWRGTPQKIVVGPNGEATFHATSTLGAKPKLKQRKQAR